jgi:hypothetical protein
VGDSGRSGLICRICDRKYILYLRYQSYAGEIGIKDQLITTNQTLLDEAGKEILIKIEDFKKAFTEYQNLLSKIQSERTVSVYSETPQMRATEIHRNEVDKLRMKIDEA